MRALAVHFFLNIFFQFFCRQLEKQISRYMASRFVSGWSLCIFITYLSVGCFIAPWRLAALHRFCVAYLKISWNCRDTTVMTGFCAWQTSFLQSSQRMGGWGGLSGGDPGSARWRKLTSAPRWEDVGHERRLAACLREVSVSLITIPTPHLLKD